MSRRPILSPPALLVIISAFLAAVPVAVIAQSPDQNILFIGVDDLRIELGCYGAGHMKTPNIDALARDGMLFERAYCQQAICAASRISLMTGLRPDTTGVYDLDHPLNSTLPDAISMPRFFQSEGYRTISLGKIYHHGNDDRAYWDVLDSCSQPTYASAATIELIKTKTALARAKGIQGKALRKVNRGPAVESADVADNVYSDGNIADAAIRQLRQRDARPFFLAVGFKKPHLPFVAPKKYWDLYDRDAIDVPPRELPTGVAAPATTTWGELRSYHGMPSKDDCTDEQTRELIHGYRACVSYVDAQIGRLLAELDRQGLRDNTIIVLWGDHGWKLGEYGDWCKHTNFELDTHVPLIYSGPGIPGGQRSKALVEYIDMFPTLTQWAGLDAPAACEGKSMVPLFADPARPWKKAALSQYPRGGGMGYSLRTGPWRYTHWLDKNGKETARELYDHSDSDVATENLAGSPEHAEIVDDLQQLLSELK